VTYLGYPGSTGVPNIDYLLADAVVAPANNDTLFSEHVLRFSSSVFCYAPEEHYPLPQWTEAMATRPLTFGSFNNSTKLTQRTLKLWARVLQAVPHSRLVLKAPSFADAGAQALFAHQFSNLGVDAARIEFRGPVGLPQMMTEYADIDIALDPTPYNGGTTSLQALWMGVPVLTLHGQQFVERMGASFMQAAGLPEWVATSEDDYVDIAQRMASDRHALLNLKKGLRTRLLNQPAWDAVRHTRELEDLLLQAALT
jgi:predicted O-linked N-acetylglucosamine transferase (SPINDLY family)